MMARKTRPPMMATTSTKVSTLLSSCSGVGVKALHPPPLNWYPLLHCPQGPTVPQLAQLARLHVGCVEHPEMSTLNKNSEIRVVSTVIERGFLFISDVSNY